MKISFCIIVISVAVYILTSCSTSSNEIRTTKKFIDSTYVFDEVPPENIYKFDTEEKHQDTIYIIQIGAFSTLEKAKEFSEFSRAKLKKDIKVEFKKLQRI